MHIVSLFPELFDFSFLATGVLRVTLGIIFILIWYKGITLYRTERIHFFEKLGLQPAKIFFIITSTLECVSGALLIIGLWTQGVALVMGLFMLLVSFIKKHNPSVLPKNTIEFYVILSVVSFALVFLSAGAFAVDLPV